jgi:hypothetical protein
MVIKMGKNLPVPVFYKCLPSAYTCIFSRIKHLDFLSPLRRTPWCYIILYDYSTGILKKRFQDHGGCGMDKGKFGRRDRLVKDKYHDTYREGKKRAEPSVCSKCGSVYTGGRWTWTEEPEGAVKVLCPACQRIADAYPAGYVELKGAFFDQRREEILNLVSNEEKMEKGEHPMERVMAIKSESAYTLITTTGVHMARRIGEAVARAYQGNLEYTYGDNEKTIRVQWVSK